MNATTYPFPSAVKARLETKKRDVDYGIWTEEGVVPELLVDEAKGDIVEIGGPTEDGYYFLDEVSLRGRLRITNIREQPSPFHSDSLVKKRLASLVDELVDGRSMPYANHSVDMVLMAAMSLADDHIGADGLPRNVEMDDYIRAQFETNQVALGLQSVQDSVYAQRLHIYQEVYRVLTPGGLFVSDGRVGELRALQVVGFRVVALLWVCNANTNGLDYEFIVQKTNETDKV